MPATVQSQTKLTYQPVARWLPAEDKQKLAKLLDAGVAATLVHDAVTPLIKLIRLPFPTRC